MTRTLRKIFIGIVKKMNHNDKKFFCEISSKRETFYVIVSLSNLYRLIGERARLLA